MTLTQELSQFIGTENYYQHWLKRFVFTDGVKFLADTAGAHWLIDIIASHQRGELKSESFQVWTLEKAGKGYKAVADDGNGNELRSQYFEYTDFPNDMMPFKLYLTGGVLMLPSEY